MQIINKKKKGLTFLVKGQNFGYDCSNNATGNNNDDCEHIQPEEYDDENDPTNPLYKKLHNNFQELEDEDLENKYIRNFQKKIDQFNWDVVNPYNEVYCNSACLVFSKDHKIRKVCAYIATIKYFDNLHLLLFLRYFLGFLVSLVGYGVIIFIGFFTFWFAKKGDNKE